MLVKHVVFIGGVVLTLGLAAPSVGQFGRGGGAFPGGRGLPPSPDTAAAAPAPAPDQPPPLNDFDTVLLTVSVTGSENKAVPGISRDRFQVLEDGVEQEITYFWEDSRPITAGFIFDDSKRMDQEDKVYVIREAAQSFLKEKDPRDEFFVVRMADLADVVVSFTTEAKDLPLNYSAIGETALYDAVYVGLSVIKEAANPRKVLLVITSGGDRCGDQADSCSDNFKRTTEQMLKEFALKQPVQIYTLFVAGDIDDAVSEMVHRDALVLSDLATMTGGRYYTAPNAARTVEAMTAEVARGLKTQYIVGYKSMRAHDGKRRGVKVKVDSPEDSPKLNVWTKAGYYAPKDR